MHGQSIIGETVTRSKFHLTPGCLHLEYTGLASGAANREGHTGPGQK